VPEALKVTMGLGALLLIPFPKFHKNPTGLPGD